MPRIILLFFYILSIKSLSANDIEIQKDLRNLNYYIQHQDTYIQLKEDRISHLKKSFQKTNLSLEEQYSLSSLLYEEYSTYKYDSMYVYAEKMLSLGASVNDKDLIVKAQLAVASALMWGGLFKDASEYFSQINREGVNQQTLIDYWTIDFSICFENALYSRYNEFLYPKNKAKMQSIIEEIERISPADFELITSRKFELAFHNNENAKVIEYGLELKKNMQNRDTTSTTYSELLGGIGYSYINLGDTLRGMHYMVESAILGIKQGSSKYAAMRRIAEATYGKGYLKDAYLYIQLSMANAKFFGSRYRIYEASKILPKVDADLNKMLSIQKKEITNLLIITLVIAVILVIIIVLFVKRNNKLRVIKEKLHEKNDELIEQNIKINQIIKELSESNKIKEAGIGQLFNTNLEYYNKLETLQKGILRKIKARQIDDLNDFIINSELFRSKDNIVKNFDIMFLQLFPRM